MFDIVFIFFLFLVGVTCILYYLPPNVRKPHSSRQRSKSGLYSSDSNYHGGGTSYSCNDRTDYEIYYKRRRSTYTNELAKCDELAAGCCSEQDEAASAAAAASLSQFSKSKTSIDCVVRVNENCVCVSSSGTSAYCGEQPLPLPLPPPPSPSELIEVEIERTNNSKLSCYVQAKDFDIKNCNGPVFDV